MCGRYFFEAREGNPAVMDIIAWVEQAQPALASIMKTGEICPTDIVPILVGERMRMPGPVLMRWGFSHPSGKGQVINARSETAWEKPMFRTSAIAHRCLIPALNYFEWEKRDKQRVKYAIRPADEGLLYMAGLYRMEKDLPLPVFTILTKEASKDLAFLHDRMPVILKKEVQLSWLTSPGDGKDLLAETVEEMEYCQVS